MIRVEVVYALPDQQYLCELSVQDGCTAAQALDKSGLKSQFPDVDFASLDMGIFSRPLDGRVSPGPDAYIMRDGDRLELYRPLLIDPKRARLQRAAKKKKAAR
ncbi:MAG: RnfH family protein [Pseudohongiella sp.]|nr:RnfH family protein [Pseudohongiella sp.]MDO9521702.1 RnfH family protein [Pseudohongiella sp.]MDP2128293.1 RnfH family protein [Pseudohongiella sp.]